MKVTYLLFLTALLVLPVPVPAVEAAPRPSEHTVHINANSYAYQPAVVRVNPGDRVVVELAAADVTHGFYLDGYDLEITAEPGRTSRLAFTAGIPGIFRFRCSIPCGPLHPFMIGKLQVGPNLLLWKAAFGALLAAAGGLRLAFAR